MNLDLNSIAQSLINPGQKEKGGKGNIDPSKGRSDDVPGLVDGSEQVALSEGEFIIPADVVAAIGQGNAETGAQLLSNMITKIREKAGGNPDIMV
jgi:hypothetical protein